MDRVTPRVPLRIGFLVAIAVLVVAPGAGARAQSASPAPTARYRVTDLGTLGGPTSDAYAVNALGHVVGDSDLAPTPGQATPAPGTTAPRHAFLWKDGGMTDLGTLGGATSTTTTINDQDHVAGGAQTPDGNLHAFLWRDGAMTDLGTLGGDQSQAIGINNRDQISGLSTTAPGQELGGPGTHAFFWENGTMTDLGTFGGAFSRANGLNEAGQVVGGAETADGATHPFVWANGTMTDLGTLPGYRSGRAIRIDAAGDVVGFMLQPIDATPTAGAPQMRGFVYRGGRMIDIGTLGGPSSVASGIDAAGEVIGSSDLPDSTADRPHRHGALWVDGALIDLNDLLVPGTAWEIVNSPYIGETGMIAGTGITADGVKHAVLLTPAA